MEKREDRRYRTQRHAARQWDSYVWVLDLGTATVTPGRFRKRHAWGCNCRKRAKGRPRVMSGACYLGGRRVAVGLRDAWLIERRLWMTDQMGEW